LFSRFLADCLHYVIVHISPIEGVGMANNHQAKRALSGGRGEYTFEDDIPARKLNFFLIHRA
jgi:hypothetical protein